MQREPLADMPDRVVSGPTGRNINVLPDRPAAARPPSAPASGRLLKPATRPEIFAGQAQPESAMQPSLQESALEPPQGAVVPAPFPEHPPEEKPIRESHLLQFPAPIPAPEPSPALAKPAAAHQEFLDQVPPYDFGHSANPSPLPILPGKDTLPGNPLVRASDANKKVAWDVQLLYWAFPEYDPSLVSDYRLPRTDFLNEMKYGPGGKPSLKLQVLSWLYPDLHLENVEKTRREDRAAPRLVDPGLVAYFFTGGAPRPNTVKNISVTGFYMITEERWLPGTIIRITLQIMGSSGENPHETITVHSRVVRWGADGGGFEFVLPGFVDGI
jgi:hypothetical protein